MSWLTGNWPLLLLLFAFGIAGMALVLFFDYLLLCRWSGEMLEP